MKRIAAMTAVILTLTAVTASAQNGVRRDFWASRTISNMQNLANNPNYLGAPTSSTTQTAFYEAPQNVTGGQFVARYVARLRAPASGQAKFWIACNYRCMLWISTNPANFTASPIARMMQPTAPSSRQWTRYAEQASAFISITANTDYYILAVHQENTDNINHLAVGWQLPSGAYERPIPGSRLVPYVLPSASVPTVTLNANPTSVGYGQSTTLSWSATGSPTPTCTASNNRNNSAWTGNKAVSGTQTITLTTSIVFTLACTNSGGTGSAQRSVAVIGNVTVAWDANSESDLAGYEVLYGQTNGGPYNTVINTGLNTSQMINNFPASGRYYFVVRAYNNAGQRSANSAQVYTDVVVASGASSQMSTMTMMSAPTTSMSYSAATQESTPPEAPKLLRIESTEPQDLWYEDPSQFGFRQIYNAHWGVVPELPNNLVKKLWIFGTDPAIPLPGPVMTPDQIVIAPPNMHFWQKAVYIPEGAPFRNIKVANNQLVNAEKVVWIWKVTTTMNTAEYMPVAMVVTLIDNQGYLVYTRNRQEQWMYSGLSRVADFELYLPGFDRWTTIYNVYDPLDTSGTRLR